MHKVLGSLPSAAKKTKTKQKKPQQVLQDVGNKKPLYSAGKNVNQSSHYRSQYVAS